MGLHLEKNLVQSMALLVLLDAFKNFFVKLTFPPEGSSSSSTMLELVA